MKYFIFALLAFAGGQAQAQDVVPQVTEVYDVYADSDNINIVFNRGEAAVELGAATMAEVHNLCTQQEASRSIIVNEKPMLFSVSAEKTVVVVGKDSGYKCPAPPMPQAVGPIADEIVEMWPGLGRNHEGDEFTQEHLRAVLQVLADSTSPMVIKREDLKGWHGDDLEWLNKAFEDSTTGQFPGYLVDVNAVRYFIVQDVCLEICQGPAVIWHLHKSVPKAHVPSKKKKTATTPSRKSTNPRPGPATGIEMLCTGPCN